MICSIPICCVATQLRYYLYYIPDGGKHKNVDFIFFLYGLKFRVGCKATATTASILRNSLHKYFFFKYAFLKVSEILWQKFCTVFSQASKNKYKTQNILQSLAKWLEEIAL